MAHLKQYVPIRSLNYTIEDPSNDDKAEVGGDQLTVERATGSQINSNNEWRGAVTINSDPTACEDFVVKAHIISLTMKEFGFTSMDSNPTNVIFGKEQFLDKAPDKKKEMFDGGCFTIA